MTGRLGGIGSPAGENPGSTRLRTDLHWLRVLYGDAGENPLAYRSSLNLKLKVLDFVKFGGLSETETHNNVRATSVLHFKYAIDPERPWRGNSPIGVASLAGRLSAETMHALADESSGPRGQLLGLPVDGNDPTMAELKSDVAKARGRMAFLQTGD